MLKFARRSRWLLPLLLLLTVVILQVCMPAGGSERGEQRSSRLKVDEREYGDAEYETEGPYDEMLETEPDERVTMRSRKPLRRYYNQRIFVLVPLILAGLAAAYAAAGYVVRRSRSASEGRWFPSPRKAGEKVTGWFPWLSRGKQAVQEQPEESVQSLIRTGKRVLAPAAAMALAVGVASFIYNQQMLGDGGASFLNSTVFAGGPPGATSPAGNRTRR